MFIESKRNSKSGILPGNSDHESNLVLLTLQEHLLCHKLLVKSIIPSFKGKMIYSIFSMIAGLNIDYRNLSSKKFAIEKEKWHKIYQEFCNTNDAKICCEFCGNYYDMRNYKKWHSENCLLNPTVNLENRRGPTKGMN